MLRSSGLGALSALAASAGAIMITPSMSPSAAKNHGPGALGLVDPYTQLLEVHCPGCAYAVKSQDGSHFWTEGVENSLYANISVGSNPETLEFNGVQFYPPLVPLTAEPEPIFVTQAPKGTSLKEIRKHSDNYPRLRLTSWGFLAENSHTVNESGEEILTIRLSLNALEQHPIAVDDVVLTALKNPNAQLMLLKSEVEPRPSSPHALAKECNDWPLLCKWKSIIADRLQQMRGKFRGKCHKRPHGQHKGGHHNGGHHKGGMEASQEGEMRPHHRPHRPHHPHHGFPRPGQDERHPVMNKIARLLLVIVIPILIGILVGMLTYLVGMLIGTGIALLWMRIRGRRAEYSRIALEDDEELAHEQSEKLNEPAEEYVDAPPEYNEAEAK